MDSGYTSRDLLQSIERSYHNKYAEKIRNLIPALKDVDVLAMEWDKLKQSFLQSEMGKYYLKVETFPIDLTMMSQDYDMFTGFSLFSCYNSHFINDSYCTQIQMMSSFLQSKPKENEVRILCIIGHGLSQQQAKLLNENPPAFDNDRCTDSSEMKSCQWKWSLINCNDKEGLGKGYTARSVCENAKKGDVVVFASGFLTPEWIVEQLRKREKNEFNGKISFTLVLLVDSCYSGVWTKRIETDLLEHSRLNYTRLVVQTSCAAEESSYGQCFIPYWCAMQNENKRGKQEYSDETQNCKQTPTLYDSDHKKGNEGGVNEVGVLKFFPHGQSLQYKFNYTVERGAHSDLIKKFSCGKGKIHSYKLKHYEKDRTPMAFFLVEVCNRMIHLHVHFKVEKTYAENDRTCREICNKMSHLHVLFKVEKTFAENNTCIYIVTYVVTAINRTKPKN